MSRSGAAIILPLAAFALIYGMSDKKLAGPAVPAATSSGEDSPDEQAQAPAGSAPSAPSASALRAVAPDARPAPRAQSGGEPFLVKGKISLNLAALLLKSPQFRAANPQLTFESLKAGPMDISAVRLPDGLRLSYEMDPACENHDFLKDREKTPAARDTPVFVSRALTEALSVEQLADGIGGDSCVVGIATDQTTSGRTQAGGPSKASGPAPATAVADKGAADTALTSAQADGKMAKLVVLGTPADIQTIDPNLLSQRPDGRYRTASATYSLGTADPQASLSDAGTQAPETIRVGIHPYTVPVSAGAVSDASVSNSIIAAVQSGAKVVDIAIPDYDPANFAKATAYAQEHGAVVVNNIPLPIQVKPRGPGMGRVPAQQAPATEQR